MSCRLSSFESSLQVLLFKGLFCYIVQQVLLSIYSVLQYQVLCNKLAINNSKWGWLVRYSFSHHSSQFPNSKHNETQQNTTIFYIIALGSPTNCDCKIWKSEIHFIWDAFPLVWGNIMSFCLLILQNGGGQLGMMFMK